MKEPLSYTRVFFKKAFIFVYTPIFLGGIVLKKYIFYPLPLSFHRFYFFN